MTKNKWKITYFFDQEETTNKNKKNSLLYANIIKDSGLLSVLKTNLTFSLLSVVLKLFHNYYCILLYHNNKLLL